VKGERKRKWKKRLFL